MAFDIDILPKTVIDHREDPAAQRIAIHVAQDAQIAIYALNSMFYLIDGLCLVKAVNRGNEIAYGTLGRIDTAELNHSPSEFDSLRIMLNIEFILVQLDMATVKEHLTDFRHGTQQPALTTVYDIEVIDIAPMIREAKITLEIPVKQVEQEVSEQLTGEVSDGQAKAIAISEERLVRRQMIPFLRSRATLAVKFGAMHHNDMGEPEDIILIMAEVITSNELAEHAIEQQLVDRHEEALEIEAHHVAATYVVLGALSDIITEHINAVEHAFLLTAVKCTVAEDLFKERLDTHGYEVMYHTITEVSSKDLAVFRTGNDESDAGGRMIFPRVNLVSQADKILAVVQHIVNSAGRATLVLQAQVVSAEYILVSHHINSILLIDSDTGRTLKELVLLLLLLKLPLLKFRFQAFVALFSVCFRDYLVLSCKRQHADHLIGRDTHARP